MDKADFLRVAVTVDYFYPAEARDITGLLMNDEFDYVHIRKPGSTPQQVRDLVEQIPSALHSRLTLHDHHEIAVSTGVGGVHLNRRFPVAPAGWRGRLSRSCHSPEECRQSATCDYVTLSPIYPSISKPGYHAEFDSASLNDLLRSDRTCKIIALGGITSDKVAAVRSAGFDGYAMLSDAWRTRIEPEKFCLQFITHPESAEDAVRQVRDALAGGCRWIQLRWKDAEDSIFLETARAVGEICRKEKAVFILDDRVDLVEKCGADGVHLGKNDMSIRDARALLGPKKIIGATANQTIDIMEAARAGADYIGLGPYRFTTTKKNLSTILGVGGYTKSVEFCLENHLILPIVAIGGITPDDVSSILATGVDGVAVSGAIINAPDPTVMTARIIHEITTSSK